MFIYCFFFAAVFITQEAVTLSRYDFLLGLEAWKVRSNCDTTEYIPIS